MDVLEAPGKDKGRVAAVRERDTPGEVRHEPPGDPRQHVDMLDPGGHN